MDSTELIEIDMFAPEVNDLDHWEVVHFKGVLEEVAEDYGCELVFFDINNGTVTFAFNSEPLMADILKILRNDFKS